MTESESIISSLNSSFFFQEFTFSNNKFKTSENKDELELADNVVWLDDILIIIQIKEKEPDNNSDSVGWFDNKVLKKAVKQIKNTVKYYNEFDNIEIKNDKGHILNLNTIRNLDAKKIIVYNPGLDFPESKRFQKFYISQNIDLIHLFHIEDYFWICKYLITPFEIHEYLNFRESLYQNHTSVLNNLPEKYVLGHYLKTLDASKIIPEFIENVSKFIQDIDEFDMSHIIKKFQEQIYSYGNKIDYYNIIKEIAKLDRASLREFKKRFEQTLEDAQKQIVTLPYRFVSLNSHCGFVFIPIDHERKDFWKNAVINLTLAHKYELKLKKSIGVIVYYDSDTNFFEINWCYIEFDWHFDQNLENLLSINYPFRPVSSENRYRYFMYE